jgi:hypothetical protein
MNLFRSEEHVRNWSGFKEGTEEGILELSGLGRLFSGDLFRRRLDPDYVSRYKEYGRAFATAVKGIGRPFWSAPQR